MVPICMFVGLLVFQQCSTLPLPREEVVSVYTTQSPAVHHSLDVYHQIATNIAERITSPIYRVLGVSNKMDTTTEETWNKIEVFGYLDEEETEPPVKTIDQYFTKYIDLLQWTGNKTANPKDPQKTVDALNRPEKPVTEPPLKTIENNKGVEKLTDDQIGRVRKDNIGLVTDEPVIIQFTDTDRHTNTENIQQRTEDYDDTDDPVIPLAPLFQGIGSVILSLYGAIKKFITS